MSVGEAPLDVARASKLNQKLRLDQLGLHQVECRYLSVPPDGRPGYDLDVGTVRFGSSEQGVAAFFPVNIAMHGPDSLPFATIALVHRVIYRRNEGWVDSDEEWLADYVGIVGSVQVWPYTRAEVQSLTSKMGLPALILPVLSATFFAKNLLAVRDHGGQEPAGVAEAEQVQPRRNASPKKPRKRLKA